MYLFDLGELPYQQSTLIFSGDFSLLPKSELDGLQSALRDTEREKGELTGRIEEFYEETRVKPKDITKAIVGTEAE